MIAAALGQVFTPAWLARLTAEVLLDDDDGGVVLDPACGDGSLLLAVCDVRRARGWDAARALAAVEGWDADPAAAAACREALIAWAARHGAAGAPRVRTGDALADRCPDGGAVAARFSAVIMNPPFVEAKRMGAWPGLKERLRAAYPDLRGAFDLYVPFLRRAMDLLRDGGRLAAILPGKVLQARYAADLRRAWLRPPWTLDRLVDLTRVSPRPFPGTGVYPVVLRVRRGHGDMLRAARATTAGNALAWRDVALDPVRAIGGEQPLFVPFDTWGALAPLFARGPRLGDVARFVSTCSFHQRGERERYVVPEKPDGEAYPYLGGPSYADRLEIEPFAVRWAGWWIRAEAWEAGLPSREGVFARPKLILAQHATRPIVVMDPTGRWVTKDTYPVGWPTDPRWSLEALCAVVSSTVFAALYNTMFQGVLVGGETYHYLPAFVHQVPIPAAPPPVDGLDASRWDAADRLVSAAYGVVEDDRRRMITEHLARVSAPAPT